MRSPRERDVIILVSMSLRERKQALYDLVAHLLRCKHTRTQKHAHAQTKTSQARLQQRKVVFVTSGTATVRTASSYSTLQNCFPGCLLSYKLCSKIQITLSNLHDHNRIKLFMLITPHTSRRVLVTSLSFTGQLSASLFLAVCVWPLPELLSECAWPLRVFLHHQPWRDSRNI